MQSYSVQLWSFIRVRQVWPCTPSPRCLYIGHGRLWPQQLIYRKHASTFIFSLLSFSLYRSCLPCPSTPRVWIIFTVLRWKAVVSPPRKRGDLCCFARKASVRRHESMAIILVLRGSFACQHNWRLRWGRSIDRSLARSCYVESVIHRLQSTTVTWIPNIFM
jgi:hypothetical protein